MMKVNEIFMSIEGEGSRTGYPCTFVRLYGCNLRCSYCDTRYSCEDEEFTEMTIPEILTAVIKLGKQMVTVTGGEPLIHEDAQQLISALAEEGFWVNIETNGSIDITPYVGDERVFVTMDYKSLSSDMNERMLLNNIGLLRESDVLKFVVGGIADLSDMRWIIASQEIKAMIFVSPVFGEIDGAEIVEYLLKNNLNQCRVQIQLHKIIWAPDRRGV